MGGDECRHNGGYAIVSTSIGHCKSWTLCPERFISLYNLTCLPLPLFRCATNATAIRPYHGAWSVFHTVYCVWTVMNRFIGCSLFMIGKCGRIFFQHIGPHYQLDALSMTLQKQGTYCTYACGCLLCMYSEVCPN